MDLPDGFCLAAILAREEARDAWVSNRDDYHSLAALPAGAVVGTSSLRRAAAIQSRYPQLVIKALRGNVGTRLKKLDAGEYDAIVLAAAGLKRLGLGLRIRALLSFDESLPAIGQGALAIECLSSRPEVIDAVQGLHRPDVALCVAAERAFGRALSGSCHTPLAAHATLIDGQLLLRGFLANADSSTVLRGEMRADMDHAAQNLRSDLVLALAEALGRAEALGLRLADDFKQRGALALLATLQATS